MLYLSLSLLVEQSESFYWILEVGGGGWESNPPKTLFMPPDGFEVREAHRDSFAPSPQTTQVYLISPIRTNPKH